MLTTATASMKTAVVTEKPKEEKDALKEERQTCLGTPTQKRTQQEPDRQPPMVMRAEQAQKAKGSYTLEMTLTPPKTSKPDFVQVTNSEACVL